MNVEPGQVAVITGAASGIGRGLAQEAAARGLRLVLSDIDGARLAALAAELQGQGAEVTTLTADISDTQQVEQLRELAVQRFGGVDLLFNNAGVMLPSPVVELRTDQWSRQIDINIGGLMNAIGAFTPQLVRAAAEKGVADLVNTSSIAAQNIFENFAVYTGSKAFVSHASRNLRTEFGAKNVRVAVIEPGIVKTELQGHVTDPGATAWLDETLATQEVLEPSDVAEAVAFLAQQPARVNFQQLTIMPTFQQN